MTGNIWIRKFPWHDILQNSKYLLNNMGEVLRKFSKNQVMEIYGSVSEAGELGQNLWIEKHLKNKLHTLISNTFRDLSTSAILMKLKKIFN